jgi:hypothetical protein
MECYEKLARAAETEAQFRAIGLAGQANVHVLRDEQSLADKKLAMLVQVLDDLPPDVQQAIGAELHPRLRAGFQRLRSEVSGAPGRP